MASRLYRIREISDLFVDACVRHPEDASLLFLSVYGRDASVSQFYASFSLPASCGGLTQFTLVGDDGTFTTVMVPDSKHLKKTTGKLSKGCLFGQVNHAWVYHADLAAPDHANRTAWGVYPVAHADAPEEPPEVLAGAWQLVRELAAVPLADEWRDSVLGLPGEPVISWLHTCRFPPVGCVRACRINVGGNFVDRISDAVRDGELRLTATPVLPPTEAELIHAGSAAIPAARGTLQLGQISTTAAVHRELPPDLLTALLSRHRSGDWGDLDAFDKRENDAALASGEARILSSYLLPPALAKAVGQEKVWIITEWDRQHTTVLYPSDR